MIEMIMYFGGGFLVASLLAIVLISFVHQRAVRLTQRRLADAIPVSMAEIQADKDHLRAEFALSARRARRSLLKLLKQPDIPGSRMPRSPFACSQIRL